MYHFVSFSELIDCIDPVLQSIKAQLAFDAVDKDNNVGTIPVSPEVVQIGIVACTVKYIHCLGILINLDDALLLLHQFALFELTVSNRTAPHVYQGCLSNKRFTDDEHLT